MNLGGHPRTAAILLAIGGAAALAMFLLVRFPADTALGTKLFFSAVIGGFAAFGAWSLAGLADIVRALADWIRGRGRTAPPRGNHHVGPLPELSPARKSGVRRIVTALGAHGVFAPDVPDPALLYAGVADADDSVSIELVIAAACEVDYYHPGTDPARFLGNLVMLDTKAGQDPDYLRQQVADLARIAGPGFDVSDVVVDAIWPPAGRTMPVRIAMRVNGAPLEIA